MLVIPTLVTVPLITTNEIPFYQRKLFSVTLKFINKTAWWDTNKDKHTRTRTCLGRAGAPPYHWNRAFQSESGTNSKSRHLTSIRFRFSFPPSPVRVTTLQVGAATRTVLSMGPGAGGGPTVEIGMTFLGCRGEWLGLDVTLGDLKQKASRKHGMWCLCQFCYHLFSSLRQNIKRSFVR